MMPIGPMMIEHRLLDRMVYLLRAQSETMPRGHAHGFAEQAMRFMRVYADRGHHGKEEQFLFAALEKKELSLEHRRILKELWDEHAWARDLIERITAVSGSDPIETRRLMRALADGYAAHIEKEDQRFFIPAMAYFDQAEQDAMLRAIAEFDQRLYRTLFRERVVEFETTMGIALPLRGPAARPPE